MTRTAYWVWAVLAGFSMIMSTQVSASSSEHSTDGDHQQMHFSPPLIGKNPTPISELRVDHFYTNLHSGGGNQNTIRLVGEYAPSPSFSMEMIIPYTFLTRDGHDSERNLDTVIIGGKYANFAFADNGIVFGGGLEVGLPTGDHDKHIGTERETLVEPYVSLGWATHGLEMAGAITFGIPTNAPSGEPDWELLTNVSVLYHMTSNIRPFAELFVEKVYGGDHDGDLIVRLTPGLKVVPWGFDNIEVGIGVSVPVSKDKETDVQSVVSLFYHF